jgi:hypothetical protein
LQVTKSDVIAALEGLGPSQELQWMIDLGANLTISARGYYPVDNQLGSLSHLMGFNELQHQVYGRIREFRRNKEWTLDSFLDGLIRKAEFYGISGDLGWAIKSAISSLT